MAVFNAGKGLGTASTCISGRLRSLPQKKIQTMEVAVVGVADALKGQVAIAFTVPKDAAVLAEADAALALEGEIMRRVSAELGALARPARVHLVGGLPKTRSGKLLRRAMQSVCEARDPGDLSTIDDSTTLQAILTSVTNRRSSQ